MKQSALEDEQNLTICLIHYQTNQKCKIRPDSFLLTYSVFVSV
ncbi:hypothetical protein HOV93_38650 [Planctomycetes bacterium FF15]|uniref:Uncharacterized protein n=1 Tax=Bremerella alba TaxID=980252 RepID=A0A7V8V830_9BACT|nr:hypothetical protein [Bremerella alba]